MWISVAILGAIDILRAPLRNLASRFSTTKFDCDSLAQPGDLL